MKKILLFTGAAYGIYMLLKKLNANGLSAERNSTRGGFADGGQTRSEHKDKTHHGNIRGIMKKASTISHSLE